MINSARGNRALISGDAAPPVSAVMPIMLRWLCLNCRLTSYTDIDHIRLSTIPASLLPFFPIIDFVSLFSFYEKFTACLNVIKVWKIWILRNYYIVSNLTISVSRLIPKLACCLWIFLAQSVCEHQLSQLGTRFSENLWTSGSQLREHISIVRSKKG